MGDREIFEAADFVGELTCLALEIFSGGVRDRKHLQYLIMLNSSSEYMVARTFGYHFVIAAGIDIIQQLRSNFNMLWKTLSKMRLPRNIQPKNQKLASMELEYIKRLLKRIHLAFRVMKPMANSLQDRSIMFSDPTVMIPLKNDTTYNKIIYEFQESNKPVLRTKMIERNQLIKLVAEKNQHIYELIKKLRTTISDINVMLEIQPELNCKLCILDGGLNEE